MSATSIGTILLWLPFAAAPGETTSLGEALFTATSAICVTGLVVVDTGSHWSAFGELVILGLIQIGGFGIMAVTSLFGAGVLRATRSPNPDAGRDRGGALPISATSVGCSGSSPGVTIVVEGSVAVVLAISLWTTHGRSVGRAVYEGVFHSVSGFNNAGFSLYPDSLEGFVGSPVFSLSIAAAVIVGGLGFPVLADVRGRLLDTEPVEPPREGRRDVPPSRSWWSAWS